MSIAVSAVIVPSRLMRWLLLCHGAANLGAALALAGGAGTFAHPHLAGLACLLAAAPLPLAWRSAVNPRRIDISGLGQCRMTVQQESAPGAAPGVALQLLPGSTLWPALLLLRLGGAGGVGACALAVWPDALAPGQFRRLSVALRDLAARGEIEKKL